MLSKYVKILIIVSEKLGVNAYEFKNGEYKNVRKT